jgi:hypothetical protein
MISTAPMAVLHRSDVRHLVVVGRGHPQPVRGRGRARHGGHALEADLAQQPFDRVADTAVMGLVPRVALDPGAVDLHHRDRYGAGVDAQDGCVLDHVLCHVPALGAQERTLRQPAVERVPGGEEAHHRSSYSVSCSSNEPVEPS